MKILYICTHNRCRSILAEAVTNAFGKNLITAASAGSEPAGEIHPQTLECLEQNHIPTTPLYSKSWDAMEGFEADFIITVCDSAAGESCPVWFGNSQRIHWSVKDPSTITGPKEEIEQAFQHTFELIKMRVQALIPLINQDAARTELINKMNSF